MSPQLHFSLLPSEICRLILGFLVESECIESSKSMFFECPHLFELRDQNLSVTNVNCRVGGLSLINILKDYVDTVNILNEQLEIRCPSWDVSQNYVCRPGQAAPSLQSFVSNYCSPTNPNNNDANISSSCPVTLQLHPYPGQPTPLYSLQQQPLQKKAFPKTYILNSKPNTSSSISIVSNSIKTKQILGSQILHIGPRFPVNKVVQKSVLAARTISNKPIIPIFISSSSSSNTHYTSLTSKRKRCDRQNISCNTADTTTSLCQSKDSSTMSSVLDEEIDFEHFISTLMLNAETLATKINSTIPSIDSPLSCLSTPKKNFRMDAIQQPTNITSACSDSQSLPLGKDLQEFIDDILQDLEENPIKSSKKKLNPVKCESLAQSLLSNESKSLPFNEVSCLNDDYPMSPTSIVNHSDNHAISPPICISPYSEELNYSPPSSIMNSVCLKKDAYSPTKFVDNFKPTIPPIDCTLLNFENFTSQTTSPGVEHCSSKIHTPVALTCANTLHSSLSLFTLDSVDCLPGTAPLNSRPVISKWPDLNTNFFQPSHPVPIPMTCLFPTSVNSQYSDNQSASIPGLSSSTELIDKSKSYFDYDKLKLEIDYTKAESDMSWLFDALSNSPLKSNCDYLLQSPEKQIEPTFSANTLTSNICVPDASIVPVSQSIHTSTLLTSSSVAFGNSCLPSNSMPRLRVIDISSVRIEPIQIIQPNLTTTTNNTLLTDPNTTALSVNSMRSKLLTKFQPKVPILPKFPLSNNSRLTNQCAVGSLLTATSNSLSPLIIAPKKGPKIPTKRSKVDLLRSLPNQFSPQDTSSNPSPQEIDTHDSLLPKIFAEKPSPDSTCEYSLKENTPGFVGKIRKPKRKKLDLTHLDVSSILSKLH